MRRTKERKRDYRASLPLTAGRRAALNAAITRDGEAGAEAIESLTTDEQREFVRRWLGALGPDSVEAIAKATAVQAAYRIATRYARGAS